MWDDLIMALVVIAGKDKEQLGQIHAEKLKPFPKEGANKGLCFSSPAPQLCLVVCLTC